MQYSYAWEKLHAAVFSLIGPESLHKRLEAAYMHFVISRIEPSQLPEDIRADFSSLKNKLRQKGIGIKAMVNGMSESEAYDNAKAILSMYDSVCRYQKPY